MTDTLHEDLYTFMIVFSSVLLRVRNVSDRSWRENQNKYFMFSKLFIENRAVYEIMWKKNIVDPCRTQMAIWRMRIACWTPKATRTHSEYVILIVFPLF